jgi:hypothetical protein
MRRVPWFLGPLMIAAVFGCRTPVDPNLVQVNGTVRYYNLEGGFWAVRGDDSVTYDPYGAMPAAFLRDGLRVRLRAEIETGVAGTHQVGPIIKILSIASI